MVNKTDYHDQQNIQLPLSSHDQQNGQLPLIAKQIYMFIVVGH